MSSESKIRAASQQNPCPAGRLQTRTASHTPTEHVQVGLPLPGAQPPFHPLLVSQLRRGSDLAGHVGAVCTDVSEHGEHFQNSSGTEQSWDGGAAELLDHLGAPGDESVH